MIRDSGYCGSHSQEHPNETGKWFKRRQAWQAHYGESRITRITRITPSCVTRLVLTDPRDPRLWILWGTLEGSLKMKKRKSGKHNTVSRGSRGSRASSWVTPVAVPWPPAWLTAGQATAVTESTADSRNAAAPAHTGSSLERDTLPAIDPAPAEATATTESAGPELPIASVSSRPTNGSSLPIAAAPDAAPVPSPTAAIDGVATPQRSMTVVDAATVEADAHQPSAHPVPEGGMPTGNTLTWD